MTDTCVRLRKRKHRTSSPFVRLPIRHFLGRGAVTTGEPLPPSFTPTSIRYMHTYRNDWKANCKAAVCANKQHAPYKHIFALG